MKAYYAEEQQGHQPQTFMVAGQFREAEEVPARSDILAAGAMIGAGRGPSGGGS